MGGGYLEYVLGRGRGKSGKKNFEEKLKVERGQEGGRFGRGGERRKRRMEGGGRGVFGIGIGKG